MNKIDNYIGEKLFSRFGDKTERRNYYKLEKTKDYLNGKGDTNGLMYLVDVDYDHYIDINIFKSGLVKMKYRMDDFKLISTSTNLNIEEHLEAFLDLVDEHQNLKSRFTQLSKGEIPQDLIRGRKINSVLSD